MSGKLHLIVKGSIAEAKRAADARSIAAEFTHTAWDGKEAIGTCSDKLQFAVMAWFNEPPQQAPFPIGALLHWSEQTRVSPAEEEYNRDLKLRLRDNQIGSDMKHR